MNWFVGGGNIRNSPSILPQDHTFKNELGELGTDESFSPECFCLSPLPRYVDPTVALSTEKEEGRASRDREAWWKRGKKEP